MATTIKVKWEVEELDNVMLYYDVCKVYRSASYSGTYVEITGIGTRVPLVAGQVVYEYVDTDGDKTYWYRTTFFHTITLLESSPSEPIQGESGGLYCTIEDLRDEGITEIMLPDDRALRRIQEAGQLIEKWTGRWFEPRLRTFRLNGKGTRVVKTGHPIIYITSMAIASGLETDYSEDPLQTKDFVVYNRHLTQGLLQPDDRRVPRIEVNYKDTSYYPPTRATWSEYKSTWLFPKGSQNIKVTGYFGYTEPSAAESHSETYPGSQIPTNWGTTPFLITEAAKRLVVKLMPTLADFSWRNDLANRYRLTEEKTDVQSYKLTSYKDLGMQGAWSGDPDIDSIIAQFVTTRSKARVV